MINLALTTKFLLAAGPWRRGAARVSTPHRARSAGPVAECPFRYVATGVLGIGFGLAFSAMSANVVSAVPAEQTSVATGMNANIRTIGGSIGAAVMASIVTAKLEPSGLPTQAGYTTGFGVMAAVLAVAALAALLIPSQRRLGTAATKAAAVGTLAMSGDAVTAESAAGETLASELGE